ncbi:MULTISPECIES: hypothetical protein [Paraburkholderia]|uniref:Curli biogenesis system outer membrane secretion channel CsgG n=1 Tax=Paraburkholderia megapolitana TaxID=420953 RepID=A0A1I3TE74_9BURK|nr:MULTISPECIES: hypothetical protein [Paraburkholderia]MCX4165103.1 hypothetical protein [Paraburkholderia megapolitana]MDN7160596.1 hypothetical protein [Paraburkholderia sp. CHISQ3]MDQ6497643.1 hypothetical protein [Paraburkholderia megapolitana]SFJ69235.1 hypothetical protein SAMN05192543_109248 [Paraburkholderia megapolitana]
MNLISKYSGVKGAIAIALVGSLTACGGMVTTGNQNLGVTGAAGGAASAGADDSLQRCPAPLGTIAVDDGRNADWFGPFGSATQVTSIDPLLRLAVQESNCFVITSIGNQKTDSRLSRITDLQRNSGEYRAGSKQQKGQRVAADYYMEPSIVISNSPIGGMVGALGGLIPGGGAIAAIAGSVQTKASVVTLTLFDVRSAVQIAAAEGSSTATNYGAALGALGGSAGGGLGGFSKTPEGKATVSAFIDAWNKMVVSLRNYKAQDVKGGLGRGGQLKVN